MLFNAGEKSNVAIANGRHASTESKLSDRCLTSPCPVTSPGPTRRSLPSPKTSVTSPATQRRNPTTPSTTGINNNNGNVPSKSQSKSSRACTSSTSGRHSMSVVPDDSGKASFSTCSSSSSIAHSCSSSSLGGSGSAAAGSHHHHNGCWNLHQLGGTGSSSSAGSTAGVRKQPTAPRDRKSSDGSGASGVISPPGSRPRCCSPGFNVTAPASNNGGLKSSQNSESSSSLRDGVGNADPARQNGTRGGSFRSGNVQQRVHRRRDSQDSLPDPAGDIRAPESLENVAGFARIHVQVLQSFSLFGM